MLGQVSQRSVFGVAGPSARCASVKPFRAAVVVVRAERLRLGNLSPWKGSRRDEKRKGRGHAAGQGGTCGFGNRGQKSRSGPGPRPGFEGGQMPLYRRLPKLRGIAGGMGAGLPDYVVVNLNDLEKNFQPNEEVTLDAIRSKVLSISGRESKLPLKILANGELKKPLVIKATSFSEAAKQKIEAAGGKAEQLPAKAKWTKAAHKRAVAKMAAEGKDYKAEKAKKRAAAVKAKSSSSKKRFEKASKPKAAAN